MLKVRDQWQKRINSSEALLGSVFRFQNKEPAMVLVDTNYWTFGDIAADIPDDYYTDPASAFRYQMGKIDRHFAAIDGDAYIPFLHPWFGTGVLASAFGIKLVYNPKADPAVDLAAMQRPEDIDLLPTPVPGKSGAMSDVVKALDYFKANSDLPVAFTDCQGPLATILQVIGYDKFCYWVQDDPARIHALMNKVTDALIAWVRFQKERAGQPMNGCNYPLSIKVPEGFGGVWMADDDSVIMGPDMYAEFVKPYNEKFLAAFGGGCIHYCGNSTQNIANYCNTKGVTAINNFMLDDFESASKIRRTLRDKSIVFMACDFAPADRRLDGYFRELAKAMDGAEGLVVASYIAPAVALDKGKYDAVDRDRDALASKVWELMRKNLWKK